MSDAIYTRKIKFTYTNYRGETSTRTVHPIRLHYRKGIEGAGHGGDYTGWCLTCWDHDKQATRTFALENIKFPDNVKDFTLLMLHPGNVEQGDVYCE